MVLPVKIGLFPVLPFVHGSVLIWFIFFFWGLGGLPPLSLPFLGGEGVPPRGLALCGGLRCAGQHSDMKRQL